MKYIKQYNSPTTYDIIYQDGNERKYVVDGENSPKVIEWLKTNEFEVIEYQVPDLTEVKKNLLESARNIVSQELGKTDYKVIRQVEMNTLSEQDFANLKMQRQMLRDKFNDYEIEVNNCETYEEAISILFEIK